MRFINVLFTYLLTYFVVYLPLPLCSVIIQRWDWHWSADRARTHTVTQYQVQVHDTNDIEKVTGSEVNVILQ